MFFCCPDVSPGVPFAEVAKPLRLRTEAGPIITNAVLDDCTPELGDVGLNAYVMCSSFVALLVGGVAGRHVIV